MSAQSPVLVIGVTGHLQLDANERAWIRAQAAQVLSERLATVPDDTHVRLLSGLAPGADLILTDVVHQACHQRGLACSLTAILTGSRGQVLTAWQRRLEQLGQAPRAATVDTMRQRIRQWLVAAHHVVRLQRTAAGSPTVYAVLAGMLARDSDVLLVVQRPQHPDLPGGTAQVVSWWRDPSQIPAGLAGAPRAPGRSAELLLINPDSMQLTREERDSAVSQVARLLERGNALAAHEVAGQHLQDGLGGNALRYLYLRSLADTGNAAAALERFAETAPETWSQDLDWVTLRARLAKDLGLAGVEPERHLLAAIADYDRATELTADAYPLINAASLCALLGDQAGALRRLQQLELAAQPPEQPRAAYFYWATRAEAAAIRGDGQACRHDLQQANSLIRKDLIARSRTRQQIRRVLTGVQGDVRAVDVLDMPEVYVLDTETARHQGDVAALTPALEAALEAALDDAPVHAALVPTDACITVLEYLRDVGARLRLLQGPDPVPRPLAVRHAALLAGADEVAQTGGLLSHEMELQLALQQRYLQGMALLEAAQLDVRIQRLMIGSQRWLIGDPVPLSRPRMPPGRAMVGVVFADIVGYSRLAEEMVQQYWASVLPELAAALASLGDKNILFRSTFGDAVHLITPSAVMAAEAALTIQDTLARLAADNTLLAAIRMRVAVHFAPATQALDALEKRQTYFGSQLSLAARLESVTPPGSVFASTAFSAELALGESPAYGLEFMGRVALAKGAGNSRVYRLSRA